MVGSTEDTPKIKYEPWYKWGVLFLYIEMLAAVGVTVFSLYMAFTGTGGFPGKGH